MKSVIKAVESELRNYENKGDSLVILYEHLDKVKKIITDGTAKFYTADEVREIIIQRDRDIIRGRFHNNIDHYLTK